MTCDRLFPAALAATLLAGCTTVGPDYAGPPKQTPPAAFVRADAATDSSTLPAADWWRALGDPQLDGLVAHAVTANGDVAVASARLAQERAVLRGARADRGPAGGAGAGYAYTRPYVAQFGLAGDDNRTFDLFHAELDASWELDLVGRQRRGTEAARAEAEAAAASLDDVRLSVAGEVVQAYIALRGLQARLTRIHAMAAADTRLIALTEQRKAEGMADDLDLGRIRNQRLVTLADEPRLRGAIAIQIDRIAVLTGRDPGALDAELAPERPIPVTPASIRIGDPAGLIRRRPDIRAAERRLAASTARIGVATADLFPRVSLLGNLGVAAQEAGDLVDSKSGIFSIGPSISWAFLDLGRVRARIAESDARRDESLARYEIAVRGALEDSEAGLTRYLRARETLAARQHSLRAATGASLLIEQRQREGTASLFETLEARRIVLQQDERLRIAEADLASAYAALAKSLGFAWAPAGAADAPHPAR